MCGTNWDPVPVLKLINKLLFFLYEKYRLNSKYISFINKNYVKTFLLVKYFTINFCVFNVVSYYIILYYCHNVVSYYIIVISQNVEDPCIISNSHASKKKIERNMIRSLTFNCRLRYLTVLSWYENHVQCL